MNPFRAKTRVITTLEAKITRADGTVEDLGVIARHHPNPLVRLWDRARGLGRIRNGEAILEEDRP